MTSTDEPHGDQPTSDWSALLTDLIAGRDLDAEVARAAVDDIMAGRVGPARMAAFLVALRAKGETAQEVGAAAAAMRAAARPLDLDGSDIPTLDIVGTGGDRSGTVNISTMAAVVAAACGVRVMKHGNRAASSSSGAADVLEELGLPLQPGAGVVARSVSEVGIGFAFAPAFHPALAHAAPVRRELGVPTVFNILGPLTNPARPSFGAIGCADARLAPVMAAVFAERGDHVWVVRGDDGWDEITPQTTTRVWDTTSGDGVVETSVLDPADIGLSGIAGDDLQGGDARENAEVVRAALGLPRAHAQLKLSADIVAVQQVTAVNAAAALATVTGSLDGSRDTRERLVAQLPRAHAAITSGAAGAVLMRWIELTKQATQS
jgi:anthranilate phosphoribosyltransferase